MLKYLILKLIKIYQHHLSPRKGYGCAYRLHYGGSGCSGVGYRLIRRYGAVSGGLLLRKRFARCRFAAAQRRVAVMRKQGWAYYQRGDCAPDCIVPDCTDCADVGMAEKWRAVWCWFGRVSDFYDCCSCNGCELIDWNQKKEEPKKQPLDQNSE